MLTELFCELARRALVLSGMAVLLEVVLPKGSLRKYARLVVGIMLVGALIEPVADILPGGAAVSATVFSDMTGGASRADNTEEIIAAGSSLAAAAENDAKKQLAADLEKQIGVFVRQKSEVTDCEVEVSFAEGDSDGAATVSTGGGWGSVLVMLSVSEQAAPAAEDIAAAVQNDVAAFYDLPAESVRVSVSKYGDDRAVLE